MSLRARLFPALLAWWMCTGLCAGAQAAHDVPVLLLSDIHFDPFHDPGKLAALRAAPMERWEAIMEQPATANADAEFAKLQSGCHARGVDTPWSLFQSSLASEQEHAAHPLFAVVNGDLLTHGFDCRFRTLAPDASAAELSAFAAKTVAFVVHEVARSARGAPVYFSLGNNDSGCADYREDEHSAFLTSVAATVADASHTKKKDAELVRKEFSVEGNYSVLLPAPMRHARLIVLQDVYASRNYAGCNATPEVARAVAAKQIVWLKGQLERAKQHGEQVWLMAHVPPGIDPYYTFIRNTDVCGGAKPPMFLTSEDLSDTISAYAGEIRLALFGHTHMDEMRVFRGAGGAVVPARGLPSITTTNGNKPSFTTAMVDPKRATLTNWSVYVSRDGEGKQWERTYNYHEAYGEPDFSGASADALFVEFAKGSPKSTIYQSNYTPGDSGLVAAVLASKWKGYVCSATEADAAAFTQCMCGEKKP